MHVPIISSYFLPHWIELSSQTASSHETHTLYSCAIFYAVMLLHVPFIHGFTRFTTLSDGTGTLYKPDGLRPLPIKSQSVNTFTSLHYSAVKTVFFIFLFPAGCQALSHIHFSCDILHHSRVSHDSTSIFVWICFETLNVQVPSINTLNIKTLMASVTVIFNRTPEYWHQYWQRLLQSDRTENLCYRTSAHRTPD